MNSVVKTALRDLGMILALMAGAAVIIVGIFILFLHICGWTLQLYVHMTPPIT